jgi:cytosine/adenosine deaminase-related metal-dependent hydrolase
MSLLVRGGRILSGAPASLTHADLLIDGDRIAAVGPALTAPEGAAVIDAGHHIVLPGLANAHTWS